MQKRIVTFVISAVLLVGLSAGCSGDSPTPPPAGASQQSGVRSTQPYELRTGDGVDIVYFETAEPCDCMAEVGDAVERSIETYFQEEIRSGVLRFFVVVSDDSANSGLVKTFNSQPFDMFVVEFDDGKGLATPVYEIWNLMGDNDAIIELVRALVQKSLDGQG
ncbi:MAG: hypothetical protein M0R22_05875 [Dehalococcoidia bacterium]|jgi:hypothetical protein|nr:hypothetical protein [Dehalococcoidia bacterium]